MKNNLSTFKHYNFHVEDYSTILKVRKSLRLKDKEKPNYKYSNRKTKLYYCEKCAHFHKRKYCSTCKNRLMTEQDFNQVSPSNDLNFIINQPETKELLQQVEKENQALDDKGPKYFQYIQQQNDFIKNNNNKPVFYDSEELFMDDSSSNKSNKFCII
jgi:hypothetical protein